MEGGGVPFVLLVSILARAPEIGRIPKREERRRLSGLLRTNRVGPRPRPHSGTHTKWDAGGRRAGALCTSAGFGHPTWEICRPVLCVRLPRSTFRYLISSPLIPLSSLLFLLLSCFSSRSVLFWFSFSCLSCFFPLIFISHYAGITG